VHRLCKALARRGGGWAFFGFWDGEEAWGDLDEAGVHVEDGDAVPGAAVALAEAAFVEGADDGGVGEVLDEEIHHEGEDAVFGGVDFEAGAVVGDAEAVGDLVGEGGWREGLVAGELASPFEGDELPAGALALGEEGWGEGGGDDVADAFEVGH
jgi:hypothetical protein